MSLTSTAYRYAAFILLFCSFHVPATAQQPDTIRVEVIKPGELDTLKVTVVPDTVKLAIVRNASIDTIRGLSANAFLKAQQPCRHQRAWIIGGLHAGLYTASLITLNNTWSNGYPKTGFHTFNDLHEWQQMDKLGHIWSAYQMSRLSMASWKWAGLSRKKQILMGSISGAAFQTVIEILDGFGQEWGWSWSDIAANTVGSALLLGQEQLWRQQRISLKFSFHRMRYNDEQLNQRSNDLFGSTLSERLLKDYNGQTYWLSANLKSFFPKSTLPNWLNLAIGYGAAGMMEGYVNKWTDKNTNITYDRRDISRIRQWYLSPDIDFTRIPARKPVWRTLLYVLNGIKIPAPALVMEKGRFTVQGFYF